MYGLSKPSMTVTLLDSAQKPLATLLVGGSNPTGDAQYVKRSDDAVVDRITAVVYDQTIFGIVVLRRSNGAGDEAW